MEYDWKKLYSLRCSWQKIIVIFSVIIIKNSSRSSSSSSSNSSSSCCCCCCMRDSSSLLLHFRKSHYYTCMCRVVDIMSFVTVVPQRSDPPASGLVLERQTLRHYKGKKQALEI
jgi:hypothetical protein